MIITVTPGSHVRFTAEPYQTVEFEVTAWGQTLVNEAEPSTAIKGVTHSGDSSKDYLAFNASTKPMEINVFWAKVL